VSLFSPPSRGKPKANPLPFSHDALATVGFMKHTLLLVGSLLTLFACSSNQASETVQVPETVQSALQTKYPGVEARWESQPYGYEAVFTKDGFEYEAEFSSKGQWLETEYEVSDAQFPAIVLERVKGKYPGYAITKREIELTPLGTFYEVEVEQGDQQIELYFDDRANPAANSNEDA